MVRLAVTILASMVATAACLATLLPASAVAGSYVASACSPSAFPGLWALTNTFPATLRTGNLCGGLMIGPLDGGNEGGLFAEDILGSPTNMPDGSHAGWTFAAPPGTTITAISYYRTLAADGDRNMSAALITAEGTVLEQCRIDLPLGSPSTCYKLNNQVPATFTGLTTTGLFIGVVCRYMVTPGCGAGGTLHRARAVLYSARVTLSESSLPVVEGVGGGLWGGGVVWGTVPVSFAARDATGISKAVLRSEPGPVLGSVSQVCDFSLAQPCPQLPAGVVTVDTRRVGDGPRAFSLVATDAAGNSQTVTSPTVVVDNYGPPAPVSLTATPAGSREIAVAWRAPSGAPVAVVEGRVQVCAPACAAAVAVGPSGAARVPVAGPGAYVVRVWLVDAAGRGGPHNAASTTVTVPAVKVSSSVRTRIVAVIKGRKMRVSGSIARTGRVHVSWRSKVGKRSVGAGSRDVTIRKHRLAVTFVLSRRARSRRATTRVVVRAGTRTVAHARARHG